MGSSVRISEAFREFVKATTARTRRRGRRSADSQADRTRRTLPILSSETPVVTRERLEEKRETDLEGKRELRARFE